MNVPEVWIKENTKTLKPSSKFCILIKSHKKKFIVLVCTLIAIFVSLITSSILVLQGKEKETTTISHIEGKQNG